MRRPGVVRADTLDLQDKVSPSTHDHTNHVRPGDFDDQSLLPHQAQEVRHIIRERQEERQHMQDHWRHSDASAEHEYDTGTDSDGRVHSDESPEDAEGEMANEDDMMAGRMSSSPSIEDGTFSASLLRPRLSPLSLPTRSSHTLSAVNTNTLHVRQPRGSTENYEKENVEPHVPPATYMPDLGFLRAPSITPIKISSSYGHRPASKYDGKTRNLTLDFGVGHRRSAACNTAAPYFGEESGDWWDLKTLSEDATDSDDSWSSASDVSDLTSRRTSPLGDVPKLYDDLDVDDPFTCIDVRSAEDKGLLETEDIDFDFVYALHTFIATVEGQANATKGDTMVLLDDTNSYWWLVRLVKDSSIGYLPAEHIETPNERLARLNKHRNVESMTPKHDQQVEKPKMSLKKAMRRRGGKSVSFASPTYIEPSDYDYTTDEDDTSPEDILVKRDRQRIEQTQQEQQQRQQSKARLSSSGAAAGKSILSTSSNAGNNRQDQDDQPSSPIQEDHDMAEPLSPKLLEKNEAAPMKHSRKGTPRNTDSFLRDDSIETHKMSLTPGWLGREEALANDSAKDADTGSLNAEERASTPERNTLADKKKKEKKPSMLGGLFKRKDKKDEKGRRKDEADPDSADAEDNRASVQSQLREPIETGRDQTKSIQKRPGKISKQNTALVPPTTATKPTVSHVAELEGSQVAHEAPTGREDEIRAISARRKQEAPKDILVTQAARRGQDMIDSPTFMHGTEAVHVPATPEELQFAKQARDPPTIYRLDDHDMQVSPISATYNETAPVSAIKSLVSEEYETEYEERPSAVEGDTEKGFSSGDDDLITPVASQRKTTPTIQPLAFEQPSQDQTTVQTPISEMQQAIAQHLSYAQPLQSVRPQKLTPSREPQQREFPQSEPTRAELLHAEPPRAEPLRIELSQTETRPKLVETPEPIENREADSLSPQSVPQRQGSKSSNNTSSTDSPHVTSPSPVSLKEPAWSDAGLRTWLDTNTDVRDMLLVVHDTSDVEPVGKDHPLMANLFVDESKSLEKMSNELDDLLAGFLHRQTGRVGE